MKAQNCLLKPKFDMKTKHLFQTAAFAVALAFSLGFRRAYGHGACLDGSSYAKTWNME
jgi:hypothetical protein